MKLNFWLILGTLLSASALAQPRVADAPPAGTTLPAGTNAAPAKPAPAKAKKSAAPAARPAAPAAELRTVPLTPGPAIVVASNVNVRGQARLAGEVVARVTKGQEVAVLEEIVDPHSAADEPSAWAKIRLPEDTPVYVHEMFVDADHKVTASRLNVRGGPGENYSILGRLPHGAEVREIGRKGDWLEIQAPASAWAFIAAQYLSQEPPAAPVVAALIPAPAAPEPEPTPETVSEGPAVAEAPASAPVVPPAIPAPEVAPAEPAPPAAPVADEPAPKRIVQREGLVRGTVSIQAPTPFGLVNPDNLRLIDYLYTTSTNLDLSRYKGLRIIVTGEESLEERWGNTPVLTIQKIQLLD